MKELGAWVPQVFYDLIGRAVPGAFLLFVGTGLLADPKSLAENAPFIAGLPLTWSLSAGLVLSYTVGVILGGLAYIIRDEDLFDDAKMIVASVPEDVNAPVTRNDQTSFMYDALQIHHPTAGARLAKLQAERHMCSVLWMGGIGLLLAGIAGLWRNTVPDRWVVATGLLGMILASRAFYLHLGVRSKRLLMNHFQLSAELLNIVQTKNSRAQVTDQRLQLTAAQKLWLLLWWGRRRR